MLQHFNSEIVWPICISLQSSSGPNCTPEFRTSPIMWSFLELNLSMQQTSRLISLIIQKSKSSANSNVQTWTILPSKSSVWHNIDQLKSSWFSHLVYDMESTSSVKIENRIKTSWLPFKQMRWNKELIRKGLKNKQQ